jgi:hypothetical protein
MLGFGTLCSHSKQGATLASWLMGELHYVEGCLCCGLVLTHLLAPVYVLEAGLHICRSA